MNLLTAILMTFKSIHPTAYCCCSVTQLCLTLWDLMDYSTPGFPVLHYLLEFAQTHVHWVDDAIQPSQTVALFSCLQSFSASWSFLVSRLFTSGDQNIGASALASVLPMTIQSFGIDWLDLLAVQGTLKSLLLHCWWILYPLPSGKPSSKNGANQKGNTCHHWNCSLF